MKKLLVFALLLTFITKGLNAQNHYNCTTSITMKKNGGTITNYSLILPTPHSCNYQDIEDFTKNTGDVKEVKNSDNQYLLIHSNFSGDSQSLSETYNATLYPMYIDMSQFSTLYPYDKDSEIYKRFTINKTPYIDTNNLKIQEISNQLWEQAKKNIIDYARLSYEYVAKNFDYKNANTGIHTIDDILNSKGGDCGNFSSVFVCLMRAKEIPAKHIVTVRPNGTFHVWADFYLEKYGWIPVDVTMKHDYPSGEYFGYCAGDGIIMSNDICHDVYYTPTDIYNATLLQTYLWWYWGNKEPICSYNTKGEQKSKPEKPKINIKDGGVEIYWNAFKGATGYRIIIYDKNTNLIEEQTLDKESTSFIPQKLSSNTDYVLKFLPLRKVDNIETYMGSYESSFKTNEVTGIDEIEKEWDSSSIFNLNGQRIQEPHKGINIINGKKIIVK